MSYTPTPEEVAKHISAAFDSVNLINRIVAGTENFQSNADKKDCLQRNTGHLGIMKGHSWFVAGLTGTQANDIDSAILSGDTLAATL